MVVGMGALLHFCRDKVIRLCTPVKAEGVGSGVGGVVGVAIGVGGGGGCVVVGVVTGVGAVVGVATGVGGGCVVVGGGVGVGSGTGPPHSGHAAQLTSWHRSIQGSKHGQPLSRQKAWHDGGTP